MFVVAAYTLITHLTLRCDLPSGNDLEDDLEILEEASLQVSDLIRDEAAKPNSSFKEKNIQLVKATGQLDSP